MAFTKIQGSLTLIDGAGSDIETLDDVGDFTASNLQANNRGIARPLNRGVFVGVVEGDEEPVEGSFGVRVKRESGTEAAAFRFLDVIRNTGQVGADTSDNPITTGPQTFRLKYELTDGTNTTSITYGDVHFVAELAEPGETALYNVTFTSAGVIAVV